MAGRNRRVTVLKTGSTHPEIVARYGDFEDWIVEGLGLDPGTAEVVPAATPDRLPDVGLVGGVVITGSHDMITEDPPWLGHVGSWLHGLHAAPVPVLGICYGHQLIARAFGGSVGYHPAGREAGTVLIETVARQGDPLVERLGASFRAHVSHAQTVLELPPNAVLLARNAHGPHQVFRLGDSTWGVQFHPEFSEELMRCYLDKNAAILADEGKDVEAIRAAIAPAQSASILIRFARMLSDQALRPLAPARARASG